MQYVRYKIKVTYFYFSQIKKNPISISKSYFVYSKVKSLRSLAYSAKYPYLKVGWLLDIKF